MKGELTCLVEDIDEYTAMDMTSGVLYFNSDPGLSLGLMRVNGFEVNVDSINKKYDEIQYVWCWVVNIHFSPNCSLKIGEVEIVQ